MLLTFLLHIPTLLFSCMDNFPVAQMLWQWSFIKPETSKAKTSWVLSSDSVSKQLISNSSSTMYELQNLMQYLKWHYILILSWRRKSISPKQNIRKIVRSKWWDKNSFSSLKKYDPFFLTEKNNSDLGTFLIG